MTSASAAVSRTPGQFSQYEEAVAASERILHFAKTSVRASVEGPAGMDGAQAAAHGFAWLATYVEALRQMLGWAQRLQEGGRLGEIEQALLAIAFGEYLSQIAGGIPMSQNEVVRVTALGVPRAE